jgi:hypothetical protein
MHSSQVFGQKEAFTPGKVGHSDSRSESVELWYKDVSVGLQ